jgi:hypothetical protein
VRYDCWQKEKRDSKALAGIVTDLSNLDPARMDPSERAAHMINLYNATVLKLVVEGMPPGSIRHLSEDKKGFEIFDRPIVVIAGTGISLNGLEKTLREDSKDPRVHFAISCASRSCPPLPRTPFRAVTLNIQLERAARDFMALPYALTMKQGRPQVNRIFEWYKDDFARAGGPLAFVTKYAPADAAEALRKLPPDTPLDYQEYDWSLNAIPGTECSQH